MGFPSFRDMIEPLLHVLAAAPDGITARQAQDAVAKRLRLTDEELARRVAGGTQVLFRHRTNWAHDRLKRAGLSTSPRRGVWQATSKGIQLASVSASPLPIHTVKALARSGRDARMKNLTTAATFEALQLAATE